MCRNVLWRLGVFRLGRGVFFGNCSVKGDCTFSGKVPMAVAFPTGEWEVSKDDRLPDGESIPNADFYIVWDGFVKIPKDARSVVGMYMNLW
jgi:hypothetical protein